MKTLYPGDMGIWVQYLQLAMSRAGCPVMVDGIFGEETCGCVGRFLPYGVPCIVDDSVWQELIPYLKGYTTHVVEPLDTYWSLARRYRSTVGMITTANPDMDFDNLQVGEEVVIPFAFPLVPDNVNYSSILNAFIIEGMVKRYPFLVSGSIGKSVMGKDISYIQIGAGEKQLFYNAAFHANEWITTPILLTFVEDYAKAFATGGTLYGMSAALLFEQFRLYLAPMVNPDGVDLVTGLLDSGSYYNNAVKIAEDYPEIPFPEGWKANIEGVDLNLQFPAGWEMARQIKFEQGYRSPAPRDYVSVAPLTAPESIAVYDFTRKSDFQLILAYHTQGEVIYWKYSDYNPEYAEEIAEHFSEVSGYALEETPAASGNAGYKDWFIMTYNRPGYTIEAGSGINPLPISMFPQIYRDNRYILLGGMTELLRITQNK